MAWARTYLKKFGLIENSSRGIWALTEKGMKASINEDEIKKFVINENKINKQTSTQENEKIINDEISEFEWKEKLLEIIKSIEPQAFEKLCQRLLREFGFINVEVTQYNNDDGIDGKGVIRLGGVMSFHVVFQAKRYKDTVSASVVRDFRGAMIGRADKGLIITTGSFTREAKKEAQRDGVPPIDLIDGNDFADKLKDLNLGIKTKLVEEVKIDKEWFENF